MSLTPITDMLAKLLERNAPVDVILLAVRTAELSLGLSADKFGARRERERLRKREYRAKLRVSEAAPKANDVGAPVTVSRNVSPDNADGAVVLSSLSESVLSKAETEKEARAVVVEGRASKRGTRITEDFQPSDGARELARGLGLDPEALRVEFIDFWIAVPGSRGLKLDWDKTYKNRAREVAGRRKGTFNGQQNIRDKQRQATADALQQLREFAEHGGDDQGPGGEAGQPDAGRLPLLEPPRSENVHGQHGDAAVRVSAVGGRTGGFRG